MNRWRTSSIAIALLLLLGSAAAQTPAISYPPIEQVRADFRELLERPKGELKPEFTSEQREGLTIQTGTFASEPGERVPALIVKATGRTGRLPVVVCLHGTGGAKEDCADFLDQLARRGYLAVSIDARYHGERVTGGANGSRQYNDAAIAAWRTKAGEKQRHPFWYDTAYDLWRTVDYLVTRPDVDPERIGMIGISMGGIQTWLAASVDTRVRVSIPVIAVHSLRWSLENNQWQARSRHNRPRARGGGGRRHGRGRSQPARGESAVEQSSSRASSTNSTVRR